MPYIAAVLGALLIFPLCVFAHRTRTEHSRFSHPLSLRPVTKLWVDLNGDARPEQIDLRAQGYSRNIKIESANYQDHNLTFAVESHDQGLLIPYDIDHDTDLDLIWAVSEGDENFVVCINDGRGNFRIGNDVTNYAAELQWLPKDDDPSDQQSLKLRRVNRILNTSSLKLISAATPRGSYIAARTTPCLPFRTLAQQASLLSYLRERGPPVIGS